MKLILLTILNFGILFFASGQKYDKFPLVEIAVKELGLVSLDNQGFVFTSDKEGNIYQFDRTGLIVNNFSPVRQGRLTQLEASWTVNIFTFSADLQEYRILDRFLNPIAENRIPQDQVGLAKAATLGNNNIIWILDESDLSLKQFDYRRNKILQHQPLSLILGNSNLEIIDIKEYQNLLFLNIRNEGVFVFDNQANFIRLLKSEIPQSLSFWKENLVYIKEGKIMLVDFRTGNQVQVPAPQENLPNKVLIHQNIALFYGENRMVVFDRQEVDLIGEQ